MYSFCTDPHSSESACIPGIDSLPDILPSRLLSRMETIGLLAQVVVALGILNVWIIRFNRSTQYRGGGAQNMREEFQAYGLPV